MQRPKTTSLEVFAKRCLTAFGTTKPPMSYGRNFVRSTRDEREERFHLMMNKLNTFEMLSKENSNEMYYRLNVIVEELNGLGLNQMSPVDVARKILCVLPEKYGHIVSCFIKAISPLPHQRPYWGRSTLMRCTCT